MSEFGHVSVHITLTDDTGAVTRLLSWVKADKVTLPIMAGGLLAEMREAVADVRLDAPKPDPGALRLAPGATIDALTWTVGTEPVKPLYDERLAAEMMDGLSKRYTVTRTIRPWPGSFYARKSTGVCPDAPPDLCATEVPRDVATDPRVGDRVAGVPVGMSYEVAGEDMDGLVVNVRANDVFCGAAQMTQRLWRATCRTPGAVVERAPE
jgi:hypothetical protein